MGLHALQQTNKKAGAVLESRKYLSTPEEWKTVGPDEGLRGPDEEGPVAEIRIFPEQFFGGPATTLNDPVEPGFREMQLQLKGEWLLKKSYIIIIPALSWVETD